MNAQTTRLGITSLLVAGSLLMPSLQAADEITRAEFEALKTRLASLESTVTTQNATIASQQSVITEQASRLGELNSAVAAGGGAASSGGDTALERLAPDLGGITIEAGATAVVQGTRGSKAAEGDTTDASMSFDLALSSQIGENGLAFAALEAGFGEGVGGENEVGTLHGFNGDAVGDADVNVIELWYQHQVLEQLWVRVGKVDLTTDFDTNSYANDETSQFLSGGFINNLAVEFPDDNGFGVMAWWTPTSLVSVGAGVADANADWEDIANDTFSIVEVGLHPVFGELQGHYRAYAWLNAADHEEFNSGKTDAVNRGFGLSVDQAFTSVLGGWARIGWADEDVSQVAMAWSTGLDLSGSVFGRDGDHMGIGIGQARLGSPYKTANPDGFADLGDELFVETYYNWQINEHLSISPSLQIVDNAGGDGDADTVLALGVRSQLTF